MGTGITQGIGIAIAQGIGRLIDASFDQLGRATAAADNLNESVIRTNKVFGDSASEIRAWAQTADRSLGLSEQAALSNASALGNMFTQLGSSREEAARMSKQMVEVAADLAAFNDVAGGAPVILETIAAGFRGEYDSLQRYLPAITDAAIKQQALNETGKENAEQLTANEKALAFQTLVLQGATNAQGAFNDAVERGAAAEEIFTARMENARAELGQVGLIIQQEFFQTLNELLDEMGFYGENIVEQLVVGLTKGLTAVTPFLAQLRAVFVNVLRPGSPPKLLPELNDWGKAAAEEYLKGWGTADASALETLGSTIEGALRSFVGTGDINATDLVRRVFGSERSLVNAINEWRQAGFVSVKALDDIRRAAGPAGDSVGDLVQSYFNMSDAAQRAADAQEQLQEVTRRYDAALSPLQRKLDDLQDAQSRIRDEQRLEQLGEVIADPRAEASERRAARFEVEEILLRQQIDAIEEEKNAAVNAEQEKLNAAELERKAKEEAFNLQRAILDQQVENNRLLAEDIALRKQLAGEALAAQEKAQRELEAQQRKEAAELERLEGAQLRYRLQLADTVGDLEIMRAELAKTVEGSAEYFDILTEIAQLEEKLASERAGQGDGGPLSVIGEAGDAALENKQYLDDFRLALKGALGALTGGDEQPAQLTPAFQNIVDGFGNIQQVIGEVRPIVQDFIDLLFGRSKNVPTADILRPVGEGGGGFWSSIIPGIRGVLAALELIKNDEWPALWNQFDVVMAENFKGTAIYEIYTYIRDNLIPALNLLAEGEWADAWALFGAPFDPLVESAKQAGFDMMGGFWEGYVGWWAQKGFNLGQDIRRRLQEMFPGMLPDDLPPLAPKPGAPLPDFSDPNASFPGGGFPGIAPLSAPLLAGTTSTSTVGDTVTYFIEQHIAANSDFGGARAGAEAGIREALLQRRLQGT